MTPTQIHFVDGEKGGIGKSFFCRTLIDYCLYKGGDIHVVDSDTTNPDVSRFYPEISSCLTFSQKDALVFEADRLMSLAASKPVIVNLPAQSHLSVLEWMAKNYLLSLDGDLPLEIYKWFVCTGTEDSISLFLKSLADYRGSYVRHVLVKNLAFCKDWSFLSSDSSFVESGGLDVPSIEVAHLAPFEFGLLTSRHFTFNVAISPSASSLRTLSRKRIYDYFKVAREALDALSLIRFYSFPPLPASVQGTSDALQGVASSHKADEPVAKPGSVTQDYQIVVDF
jgi:hypothetical protein